MKLAILLALLAQNPFQTGNWQAWLNKGIQEFKNAKYADAVVAFRKAVELAPNEVTPQVYLGTAWMNQYIPGADSPENEERFQNASAEFRRVLTLDSSNKVALQSLASLAYLRTMGVTDPEEKSRLLDEASGWYEKVIAVDSQNKEAYYSLGVIAWQKWYPEFQQARSRLGMKPEDPGPITDPSVRQELNGRFGPLIEQGISNLDTALVIDPDYDDAMAYLNLLFRERADLRDTPAEYQRDIETADEWLQKTLDARKRKAEAGAAAWDAAHGGGVRSIRVAGTVQCDKLLKKVEPIYPALAQSSGVQGTVRIDLTIGGDGRVREAKAISGHPLLIPAALEAVRQWVYKPTLLNGQPVEVNTTVEVKFDLLSQTK